MSDIASGNARVLARLKAGHDVTPVDFQLPAIDGGKPILRVAARIKDLRNRGYEIDRVGTRNRCAVYRLASAARVVCHPCRRLEQPAPLCESCAHLTAARAQADAMFGVTSTESQEAA